MNTERMPIGFLEEAPGQKSSTRLISLLLVLAGIGLAYMEVQRGTTTGIPQWLIVTAIGGKVAAKVIERKG